MDISVQRRKVYNFKLTSWPKSRPNLKYIFNQPTIVGSICDLRMGEKMIIALFLVREKGKESTIPVGFSVNANLIPSDLKPLEIHFDNYVKIEAHGHQPVIAMIVVVAEDSKDLLAGYKAFLSKSKTHKPPNLPLKISIWLSLAKADLKKSREFSVKAITKAEFNSFIKAISNAEKNVNVTCQPDIINLDENSNTASTSGKSSNLEEIEENKVFCDLISSTREKIGKLKMQTEFMALTTDQKEFFRDLTFIQGNMIKIFSHLKHIKTPVPTNISLKKESKDSTVKDLRIIPEEDATKNQDGLVYVEGVLPVRAVKYKKFVKSLPKNILDREPNAVITNFVKFCFPNHWLTGVTVAGKGNNRSLLSLWNHRKPLINPVSGPIDETLGKARFDALIDHTMRKCGRKSYDSVTVGFLHNQICKTMYYQRTRIKVRKGAGSRVSKDTTTESEDLDDEDLDFDMCDDDLSDDDDSDVGEEDDYEDNDGDYDDNEGEKDKNQNKTKERDSQENVKTVSGENEEITINAEMEEESSKNQEISDEFKACVGKEVGSGFGQKIEKSTKGKAPKTIKELLSSEAEKARADQSELFDETEDPFFSSLYSNEQDIEPQSPNLENMPSTSTPSKLATSTPFFGLTPIASKLNLSTSSNKSQSDPIGKTSSSKTSDSGVGLTDISTNSLPRENRSVTAKESAKIAEETPTTDVQDFSQGIKRKNSEASDTGSNKVQRTEIEKDTEATRTTSSAATEETIKASSSSDPSIEVSAALSPGILALLSNPDNQKLLTNILAQMAKKT